jgi:hypothetical protein
MKLKSRMIESSATSIASVRLSGQFLSWGQRRKGGVRGVAEEGVGEGQRWSI